MSDPQLLPTHATITTEQSQQIGEKADGYPKSGSKAYVEQARL